MSENDNEYDESDLHQKDYEDVHMADATLKSDPGAEDNGEVKKKYDPKDPLRPRRKKARRACYACQRAHLTCGKLPFLEFCDHQPRKPACPPFSSRC